MTFKYALGDEFIGVLRTLHAIGLDRNDKVTGQGRGGRARATWWRRSCPTRPPWATTWSGGPWSGTHVTGLRDGRPREVYLYQMCDAQETMARYGAPGRRAGRPASTRWWPWSCSTPGRGPGAGCWARGIRPRPYLAILDRDGIHWGMIEMEPGAHQPT